MTAFAGLGSFPLAFRTLAAFTGAFFGAGLVIFFAAAGFAFFLANAVSLGWGSVPVVDPEGWRQAKSLQFLLVFTPEIGMERRWP